MYLSSIERGWDGILQSMCPSHLELYFFLSRSRSQLPSFFWLVSFLSFWPYNFITTSSVKRVFFIREIIWTLGGVSPLVRSHISADVSFQVSAHSPAVMRCSLSPSAESEVFRERCQVKRISAAVGHCLINHPVWQQTVWMLTQAGCVCARICAVTIIVCFNRKNNETHKSFESLSE